MAKHSGKLKGEKTIDKIDIIQSMYDNTYFILVMAKKVILNEIKNILKNEEKVEKITKVESRIKTYTSLVEKMRNKGYELTWDNVLNKINDLIGIRVVCNNLNEIYDIVNLIKNDKKFKIIKEKDYIRKPKESGYTSYHIILKEDYEIEDLLIPIKAEIQIRTQEMDLWANMAHDSIYKRKSPIVV